MSIWVVVLYGISVAIAMGVVYVFHARWYWHVLSVLVAFAIGFSPPISGWDGASRDVAYGFVILFLLVWGLSEPFLHRFHQHGFRHT